jgi:hypothetical protein
VQNLKIIAQLPMGLYDEVASGTAESIEEIFEKYGHTGEFARECKDDPRFIRLVNERTVELEKTGQLHVNRAAAVADMALSELARRVTNYDTPTPMLLSIYQQTVKTGRLEAPTGQVVAAGPGFSISINLNGHAQKTEKTIHEEETCIENDKNTTCIEHDDLGETPAYLKVNDELEY